MPIINIDSEFRAKLEDSIRRLLDYCKRKNWAGFDPFDGLNSKIFNITPFSRSPLCRLFFLQFIKHLPINLRPILLVPEEQNPKGLAVFASALIKLCSIGLVDDPDLIDSLIRRLIALRSPKRKDYCWGYNFDWQNREGLILKFSPNIICTTFAAHALIDYYEKTGQTRYLGMAISAGHFLLSGLNITRDESGMCFSYTEMGHGRVHNANLLGAALLARLFSLTEEKVFYDSAIQSAKYSIRRQASDGSWPYGEGKRQKWIDNFHTGYNLVALKKVDGYLRNHRFVENIRRGYQYYKTNLFTNDGVPKYYHDKVYPIDIHSISQSIITPIEMIPMDEEGMEFSEKVCVWALENMRSKKGFFFYQQRRFFMNKISYMRWSQAWMLYALSSLAYEVYTPDSERYVR